MKIQNFLLLLLLTLLSGCCRPSTELDKGSEVRAVTSLDNKVKAFVWEPLQDGVLGATVSQVYQVWIQELVDNKELELMLEADRTDGFWLSWKGPHLLEICYEDAKIFNFRNQFVLLKENPHRLYVIEIILRKAEKPNACNTAN